MADNDINIDWAKVVDILAREYGWTIDDIKKLNFGQVSALLKEIKARYAKENEAVNYSNPSKDANKELSLADFKAMGAKERIRKDGRKEIIL